MPQTVQKTVVANWQAVAQNGDLAVANALSSTIPDLIDGREWDTAANTERHINVITGKVAGGAAATAPAFDPHVAQPIQVVIADKNNPVISAYAGVRRAAYTGVPFAATPGYQVPAQFANDTSRRFFKLPGFTPVDQANVAAAYATLIADPQAKALVDTIIGPPVQLHTAQQAERQQYYQHHRATHHNFRSTQRTQSFYTAAETHLQHHTVTRSIGTEMRGEIAATEYVIAGNGYHLKMAFDGQGHTGIDQIWVRRVNGEITEYMIVEAKGSYNAKLGHAVKGTQMSPRWVYVSLMEMIQKNSHTDTARKILAAIHGVTAVAVTGGMVKCKFKPSLGHNAHDQHTIIYHGYDDYKIQWV
jgi:hypothetical protein